MSHLVREAVRLGAVGICPLDDEPMDKQGTTDLNRWGHYDKQTNTWHVWDVPTEETTDER